MTQTRPTEALDRVLHLSTLVAADLARHERVSGLTTARTHLLWLLGELGPTTQRVLADRLEVSPRNVTGLVDGLVASGHVTRQAHPSDRRATLVTPTVRGTEAVAALRASHEELADQLFGALSAARLGDLVRTLDDTIATFARLMAEAGA